MKLSLRAAAALAALLFAAPAVAADLSVKAPVATPIAYPLLNGFIFSVFTEGGGSSVNATAPGIPAASLTTTTAGIGRPVGYMFTPKKSAVSISIEGDVEARNFNGNNAGISVNGPLHLEQRLMVWAPWSQVFAALPTIWNPFSSISVFTLPTGFTQNGNTIAGLGLYASEDDISTAFAGGKPQGVARQPGIVAMLVQPVTTGGAFPEFVSGTSWVIRKSSDLYRRGRQPRRSDRMVSELVSATHSEQGADVPGRYRTERSRAARIVLLGLVQLRGAGEPMADDPGFLIQLGVSMPDLIAGFAGGVVNAIALKRSDPVSSSVPSQAG